MYHSNTYKIYAAAKPTYMYETDNFADFLSCAEN